ncbi:MAG: hypothetical protein JNJ54_25650 [Myxococcaceae bacterium]|nr:hypothetical protein [Myxococcaceae bacterium]
MSRALVVVLVSLAGCQCLQPVDERMDSGVRSDGGPGGGGGRDGGSDAGVDAGGFDAGTDAGTADAGPVACVTASDCPSTNPMQQFCGQLQSACVNGFCLLECPTGADAGLKTCTSATTECLTCNGATRTCGNCNANVCTFSAQPVRGTCPPPFDDFQNFVVQPFSGRCGGGILRDGGFAGVWVGAMMNGRILVDIPALGGACLGSGLATQIPRTLISCPACTFVAEGCE